MVAEPTHIEGEVLDLVLTDVSDVVGVEVGSQVGTSDHSAVLWMLCRSNIFLIWCIGRKSISRTLDWELMRRDVKGLNWNGIITFPCSISSLNEAFLRVTRESFKMDDCDQNGR